MLLLFVLCCVLHTSSCRRRRCLCGELQTRLPVYCSHCPAGTSVMNMAHFAQVCLQSNRLQTKFLLCAPIMLCPTLVANVLLSLTSLLCVFYYDKLPLAYSVGQCTAQCVMAKHWCI